VLEEGQERGLEQLEQGLEHGLEQVLEQVLELGLELGLEHGVEQELGQELELGLELQLGLDLDLLNCVDFWMVDLCIPVGVLDSEARNTAGMVILERLLGLNRKQLRRSTGQIERFGWIERERERNVPGGLVTEWH
jgi:hypothetical protein